MIIVFATTFAVGAFAAAGLALSGCSGDAAADVTGDAGGDRDGATGDAIALDASRDSGTSNDGDVTPSCAAYCMFVEGACTGDLAAYVSDDACRATCAAWPLGVIGDSDDSVGCREQQAELAAGDPSRCRAAGPTGGDVCGANHCTDFCALDIARCGDDAGAPYGSQSECEKACGKYAYPSDAGDGTNETGNTLNCGMYHLEKAFEPDAATSECANTAKSSPSLQFPCQ